MLNNFNNSTKITKTGQIRASNFVRNTLCGFNNYLVGKNLPPLDMNDEKDVIRLVDGVSKYTNITKGVVGTDDKSKPMENKIKLTYTKSNLGKGYIFWFICNQCGRRVRILYMPTFSEYALCRTCHILRY